jgi:sugar O-acyltransferase (sialic acid O-acetyltransferase NeuD family)
MKPVIIIGSGGHARVLLDILLRKSQAILGFTDLPHQKNSLSPPFLNIPLIGSDEQIFNYPPDAIHLVNGLGMIPGPGLFRRRDIYQKFKDYGYTFATIVHPSAVIAEDVILSEGVQVMAGAVIQTGSVIGENCIINTRTAVDHDTVLGRHVHLAPGTTVCGNVTIGEGSFVGTGSTIIPGIKIAANSIIKAGSLIKYKLDTPY